MVYSFNPLEDSRWTEFLEHHRRSSAFHTVPWLAALHRTYGYEPLAFTTSPPGTTLSNGIVFCRVESRFTGRRLVSLPFSDHCDPLTNAEDDDAADILSALQGLVQERGFRYFEIRPLHPFPAGCLIPSSTYGYCLHRLDLEPSVEILFRNCHKDSTQRKIQRAARGGLTSEDGRSPALLDSFYRLLLLTRRRHGVPPQPRRWFENLIESFGSNLQIRVAFKNRQAAAAILTLRHKETLVYKYGCSDSQFNAEGGMHLLLWASILEAKTAGIRNFDFGRSDWENTGLIRFKDRWGACRSDLKYLKYGDSFGSASGWQARAAKRMLPHLPDPLFCYLGRLLYRHLG